MNPQLENCVEKIKTVISTIGVGHALEIMALGLQQNGEDEAARNVLRAVNSLSAKMRVGVNSYTNPDKFTTPPR